MDPVSDLENALGAELLRASMLRRHPPWIAGRYCVEKFLGRGAMGLVVAATDERLGRPVALKLRPSGLDTTMLAEARALARLDHPNVVRVHDVDIVESRLDGKQFRLWMVSMQRVTGRTLRTWLAEKTRSTDEIIDVFLAAGRGVEAAHAEKIVHRDFKPDNVLIRTDGIAQVIDFGFAVPAVATRDDGKRFPFEIAGTDAYMAPEARKGRPTAKSDQFAFAIALAEALTGKAEKPGFFTPTGIPKATWAVLRRSTRTASRRYPGMTAMLRELDESRRPSRLWGWLVKLGVAVAVAVALGATGLLLALLGAFGLLVVTDDDWEVEAPPAAVATSREPTTLRPAPPEERAPERREPPERPAEPVTLPSEPPPRATTEPSDASRARCARMAGQPELRTHAGRRTGCWRLDFDLEAPCQAQFEKYGSTEECTPDGGDNARRIDTVELEESPDGLSASVEVQGRRYRFTFPRAPEDLDGTVEIESDGDVLHGTVSRFDPDGGQGARRPE